MKRMRSSCVHSSINKQGFLTKIVELARDKKSRGGLQSATQPINKHGSANSPSSAFSDAPKMPVDSFLFSPRVKIADDFNLASSGFYGDSFASVWFSSWMILM